MTEATLGNPTQSRIARSEAGFTLIETLIASLVLMFGLLSVASLLTYAVATNYENKMDAIGTSLAIRKMEHLRAQSASSLADGGCPLDSGGNIDYAQAAAVGYSETSTSFNNVTFNLRWNVNTSNGLRKIVVAARRTSGTKRYMSNILRPINVRCLKQP